MTRDETTTKDAIIDHPESRVERLESALEKIAKRYPCDTADTMSRLARETLGAQHD